VIGLAALPEGPVSFVMVVMAAKTSAPFGAAL